MDSLVYLKIFCFAGIFQPLISIIANLLNVKGKSEYTFYALVFNLLLTIPVIYIGFVFGLIELSYGILIVTILYYLLMGSLVSSQSSLSFTSQIKMILKTILLPFSCYLLTYLLIYLFIYLFFDYPLINNLIVKIMLYLMWFLFFGYYFSSPYVLEGIAILKNRILKKE